MAEIQQNAARAGRPGKRRAKKMSTRIDMTPMVDLAFLLLTFFMLTTTFAKPYTLELNMPVKSNDPTDVALSKAMTIILGKDHRVHYFFGLNAPKDKAVAPALLQTTSFAADGIRQALTTRLQQQPGLVVLIKPSADSKYQDMVDILDEMNITKQKKYALVKITQDDINLLKTSKPAAL
ncbi:biopolymer transporter ExbD [Hymenobacter sp. BT683]|uniref:Biopolymer transporter ExbD n=1 Tax=Hymenobacter jeongseonensis TaxID=2791027 RepID=A0ABS0IK57_9BACT|nr:biopolymer transporter ExbD [Hymenobacter jeongseonensis]MBF9238414.1 biopolymer transporter ExbD [Hymenobacter jeongseonensis]